MNDNKATVTKTGVGFLDFLLLVNIVLKLCGVINWSWWIVFWPLWGGIAFVIFTFIMIVAIAAILNVEW